MVHCPVLQNLEERVCWLEKRVWCRQAFSNACYNGQRKWKNFLRTPLSIYLECFPFGFAWRCRAGLSMCWSYIVTPKIGVHGLLWTSSITSGWKRSSERWIRKFNVGIFGCGSGERVDVYTVRFLCQWRKSGDGSAPMVGWWRSWPKESLAQAYHLPSCRRYCSHCNSSDCYPL